VASKAGSPVRKKVILENCPLKNPQNWVDIIHEAKQSSLSLVGVPMFCK
jgi:hypothetical protein